LSSANVTSSDVVNVLRTVFDVPRYSDAPACVIFVAEDLRPELVLHDAAGERGAVVLRVAEPRGDAAALVERDVPRVDALVRGELGRGVADVRAAGEVADRVAGQTADFATGSPPLAGPVRAELADLAAHGRSGSCAAARSTRR
jgi:hypothetical protein